jgi:hypothetical protein
VLYARGALAWLDPTAQFTDGWPPPYLDVPVERAHRAPSAVSHARRPLDPAGWARDTPSAHESPEVMTEVAPQEVTGPLPAFTPAEQARLRLLRDRYQANRARFTMRELAHLQFLRWLHQTGRLGGWATTIS